MSDKLKSSYYHKLISNVPKASDLSDEYIAELILSKSTQDDYNVIDTETAAKPGERINQVFLRNTLKSIQAHNVREEIDDSWRKHTLQKCTRKISGVRRSDPNASIHDADLREEWSRRKILKMSLKDNLDEVHLGDLRSNHSSSSSVSDDTNRSKKEKKSKKSKKMKKKSKKKHKHKHKEKHDR